MSILALTITAVLSGKSVDTGLPIAALRSRAACGSEAALVCTGVLVAPRAILTARHCAEEPLGLLEVTFEADALSEEAPVQGLAGVFRHPTLDVAILVLAQPSELTPFELADEGQAPRRGQTLTVLGFGADEMGRTGNLNGGTAIVDEVLEESFVVVPGPALSCGGDSGGPVLSEGKVVGVTSFGDAACEETATNVRVDAARGFIDANVSAAAGLPLGSVPRFEPDCGDGDATSPSSSCAVSWRKANQSPVPWWALCAALFLLGACAREAGPCPDGGKLRGVSPPKGTVQWCEASGARHGLYREWYAGTEQLRVDGSYRHGKEHGAWSKWYADGKKQDEGEYAEGLKQGTWHEYYNDGTVKRELRYTDGARTVRWTLYRENGEKWVDATNVDQQLHGEVIEWYPGGQKVAEGAFANGKKTGRWSYWDEHGQPTDEPRGSYVSEPSEP